MAVALGVIGWTPDAFWNSTFLEITSAYVGYCQREGIGPWKPKAPMTEQEADELREDYEAVKEEFGHLMAEPLR
jgi:hypothetical protein